MLKTASDTLSPGDPAPDFTLPTIDHTKVGLKDYRGKPLVIVFIRGTW
jgi:peroxiredoxin Q/BCP